MVTYSKAIQTTTPEAESDEETTDAVGRETEEEMRRRIISELESQVVVEEVKEVLHGGSLI